MNYSTLVSILAMAKGANIVGIEALTDAKARKTNNPFGQIFKHVRAVGFTGADYETAVVNEGLRQDKESSFTSEPLPWGVWHIDGKVISHKGEFYLRLQTTSGQRNRQPAKVLSYRGQNGQFLSYDSIKDFLPKKRESAKQVAAGLKPESEIMVRTYKFASIKKLRIFGQSFNLIPDMDTNKIKQIYAEIKPEVREEIKAEKIN